MSNLTVVQEQMWHLTGAGHFDGLLAEIVAITDPSDRQLLQAQDIILAKEKLDAYNSMGIVYPYDAWVNLSGFIQDMVWKPEYREDVAPRPANAASNGTTLSCDAPADGYDVYVFQFNTGTRRFTELGLLAENSTPAAGTYILAVRLSGQEARNSGLPSLFLIVT